MANTKQCGTGHASFTAAGGTPGLRQLVDDFYDAMDTMPEAARVRGMHPKDLTESRDRLALFLSGWLSGPNAFRPKYGPINIPRAHQHLPIGEAEMEAWLLCMKTALDKQPYEATFKDYLLRQPRIPAQRVRTH
jgi:hemoglobin